MREQEWPDPWQDPGLAAKTEAGLSRCGLEPLTEASVAEHTLSAPEQIRHPGGKNGFWVVRCSCGFTTGARGYPGRAEVSGLDHKRAKEDDHG